jgi:hypothetical protein
VSIGKGVFGSKNYSADGIKSTTVALYKTSEMGIKFGVGCLRTNGHDLEDQEKPPNFVDQFLGLLP